MIRIMMIIIVIVMTIMIIVIIIRIIIMKDLNIHAKVIYMTGKIAW